MKAIIVPNYEKKGTADILESVKAILTNNAIDYSVNQDITDSDGDVIITIGGDGTIIHAAKNGAELGIPILGINAGRVGYLADIASSELFFIFNQRVGVDKCVIETLCKYFADG